MDYEAVIVGVLETNCYLVYCEKTFECAIVDPGAEAEKIFRVIIKKKLKPVILINTHGHVDHVGANKDIKERFDIPLYIRNKILVLPDETIVLPGHGPLTTIGQEKSSNPYIQ